MNSVSRCDRGRRGVSRPRLHLLVIAALLLLGCATTPRQELRKSPRPPWVTRYPRDPAYYVGVGGAPDTGDPAGDLEHARARALSQLASEIEVSVRSDQTFRESASAGGSSSSTADVIVQTLTSQNLEGVELVDTFHSVADGYWFYFRLSKRTWDTIKNREMYALRDRVVAIIEPLAAPGVSVAERLRNYSGALALLTESRFAGRITVPAYGGVLDDYLRGRLGATLDDMSIEVLPGKLRLPPGRPVTLHVRVASMAERPIGELPIEIQDSNGQTVAAIVTDSTGLFAGSIRIASSKSGSRAFTVVIAPPVLKGAGEPVVARAPRTPLEIAVMPVGVHLDLTGPKTLDAAWLAESLTGLLTDRFALAVLSPDEPTPFSLSVTVRGRNAAPNEYGIAFAYCALSMVVVKDGLRIAAITTADAKGAGLTTDQAMRKAATVMLQGLPRDAALGEAVTTLISNASSDKAGAASPAGPASVE